MGSYFRAPHFIDGLVGVLQDVELVVDDGAVRSPLLNAGRVRLPHVHASRLDPLSLACLSSVRKNPSRVSCFRSKPNRLTRRTEALSRLAHGFFKAFGEGRFARWGFR